MGLNGNPIGIELTGTGTQLISWTGGYGYSITVAAAPNILLLGGAIKINLASVAQATSSLYFRYVNENDFTLALQATLQLSPGDFLGALSLHGSPTGCKTLGPGWTCSGLPAPAQLNIMAASG